MGFFGGVFGIKTPPCGWTIARSRTWAQILNDLFLFVCFVPNLQADVWALRYERACAALTGSGNKSWNKNKREQ